MKRKAGRGTINKSPGELLDELDRLGLMERESGRLRDFMLAASRMLASLLPLAAEEWLQVADRYRHKQASSADLEGVRVAAWDFLGDDSCNFQSRKVNAVRAVICFLYPDDWEGGEDWAEIVHCFLELSNDAADHKREQSELLRQLFPEYLGESR